MHELYIPAYFKTENNVRDFRAVDHSKWTDDGADDFRWGTH
jgi:hypothetical protein